MGLPMTEAHSPTNYGTQALVRTPLRKLNRPRMYPQGRCNRPAHQGAQHIARVSRETTDGSALPVRLRHL